MSRCSRARRSSTANRRSTSASALPAALRSPIPRSSAETRRGAGAPPPKPCASLLVPDVDDLAEGVPVAGRASAPLRHHELLHGEGAFGRWLDRDAVVGERALGLVRVA